MVVEFEGLPEPSEAQLWALAVWNHYGDESEKGEPNVTLPEALLWNTPGAGCFDELRTLGLDLDIQPGKGVFIRPMPDEETA